MASKKLRAAVAGLGRIGWHFHCKELAKHKDYVLAAVADPVQERCLEAETEFNCVSYSDYYEMIAAEKLDVVVIATPTHLHKPMAIAAFNKGLHVILEKPMALTVSEAESIARKAKSSQRLLTIYQPHRLIDSFQQLQQLLGTGKIGKVYWVQRGCFRYVRRNDWQSMKEFGGGMLYNYGAHFIDATLALMGYEKKIKRVFCDLQRVASLGDADDVVKVVIENSAGIVSDVIINQASAIAPYDFMIWGTCGSITLSQTKEHGRAFTVKYFDPRKISDKKLNTDLASENREYPSDDIEFTEEIIPVDNSFQVNLFTDFAGAVRNNTEPLVKPWQTLKLMRVLEQCEKDSGNIECPK